MKNNPYTIRFYLPDGDPDSIKIIDKMNWTGTGLEVSRDSWESHKHRSEFTEAGIYLLVGNDENSELPLLYIGQGDGVISRISSHYSQKLFWDRVIVFVSKNAGLNKAHITWLEWALICKAKKFNRCKLDNSITPNEPNLTEFEKAGTEEFLNEILSILPLIDIKVFTEAKTIIPPEESPSIQDTVIVPAQEDGFKRVFLDENCWHAIRIGGGKLSELKYIAAYQTAPVSAITYYAEIESIVAYGDGGKYQLNFKGKPIKIEAIPFGNSKQGSMQSPRYANLQRMLKSKTVKDIF